MDRSAGDQTDRIAPGSGRRKTIAFPKGRVVEDADRRQVGALLDGQPVRRDLLIEHLHRIQDRYGCLRLGHLAALAEAMRLAFAEVFEVATFYAHFDVVRDGEAPPSPVTVRVCEGVVCELAGAAELGRELAARLGPGARVVSAPCQGRCDRAPSAMVGQNAIAPADAPAVLAAVAEGRTRAEVPPSITFDAYLRAGGYETLRACRDGRRPVEEVIEAVAASGLRGLGGAGFPAAQKWRLVRQQPRPRLMAVNADEGEPGTFKDRAVLEGDPHRFLEGALIAAWAAEADEVYIYLRDEYPHIRALLQRELPQLTAAGLIEPGRVHLRRGAGAYICGEETAMLESIEGKRGYPRHKPPFPTQAGLFGRPTLIHNVETLFWLRDILERGPAWYADQGRRGRHGVRYFSVSGRVRSPGVKLAPAGVTARELIEEFSGGMAEGHALRAYLPGGASGGILPASMADQPLDFGTLEPHGAFIGSAAVVVLSDQDDLRAVARNLLRFFEHESCGQCTPCRCGTEKAVELLSRREWDAPLLSELAAAMRDASICGLGQAAMNPVLTLLRHAPEEIV